MKDENGNVFINPLAAGNRAIAPVNIVADLRAHEAIAFYRSEIERLAAELSQAKIAATTIANLALCLMKVNDETADNMEAVVPRQLADEMMGYSLTVTCCDDDSLVLRARDQGIVGGPIGREN